MKEELLIKEDMMDSLKRQVQEKDETIFKYRTAQEQELKMKNDFIDDKSMNSQIAAPQRMQSMGYNPNARKTRDFSPNDTSRPISRIFLESVGSIEEATNSPYGRKRTTTEDISQSPDDWPQRKSTVNLDRSMEDGNSIFYDPKQNTVG